MSAANPTLQIDQATLLDALLNVHERGHYFTPEQAQVLPEQLKARLPTPSLEAADDLTEREREILQLLCEQLTTQEIADRLFISARTVEGHKSHLLQKTGAKNIAGLVVFAIKYGIVDPNGQFLG